MSKHSRFYGTERTPAPKTVTPPDKPTPVLPVPAQSLPRGEVSTAERSSASTDMVQQVVAIATDHKGQLESINAMEAGGFQHYESIVMHGNSMIMRFRRVQ